MKIKNTHLTFALFLLMIIKNGIGQDFKFTFEPNAPTWPNAYLEYDTTGLWQIGQPQKAEWDSAYSGNCVLMTDTVNMLSQPAKASFTIKYDRPWNSNCTRFWSIDMNYSIDLPIHEAGLYFEVSYNKGNTWLQFFEDTLPCNADRSFCNEVGMNYSFYNDTLEKYYVASGEMNSWGYFGTGKEFQPITEAAKIFNVWVRVNYINTDTIAHKGIMIDNLLFYIKNWCEFLEVDEKDTQFANLYPNPVAGQSVISFENITRQEWQLNVYNLMGKLVVSEQTCNEYFLVNKNQFVNGSYVYQLTSNNKTMATGKFLVE